jgi:hypothetical protein
MDPHKILGISPDSTPAEIQKAYRRKATKYHPDAGGDAWVFQQVQQAYEDLMGTRGNSPPSDAPSKKSSSEHPTSAAVNKQANKVNQQANPTPPKSTALPYWLRHLLTGELPLQNEVTIFILVSVLDIFMTYMLLRVGAVEANPFARFFLIRWGFDGMIFFKMVTVAAVTIIAQIVAQFQMSTARKLLVYSTAIVGAVVIYSGTLLARSMS